MGCGTDFDKNPLSSRVEALRRVSAQWNFAKSVCRGERWERGTYEATSVGGWEKLWWRVWVQLGLSAEFGVWVFIGCAGCKLGLFLGLQMRRLLRFSSIGHWRVRKVLLPLCVLLAF